MAVTCIYTVPKNVKLPLSLKRRYGLNTLSVENGDATVLVLNPVRVRGDFVYHQVYTGNSKLYFPIIQCIMSFVWNLEQAAIISSHRIFWSVFIT